jgi:sulfur-carrier protein
MDRAGKPRAEPTDPPRGAVVPALPNVCLVLPRALLSLFPDAEREVDLSAATVGDAISALDRRWPGMRDRLCDSTPRIRRHITVMLGGERARLDTALKDCDRVYVLTAISGG